VKIRIGGPGLLKYSLTGASVGGATAVRNFRLP
jgi:hypothetical protein